MSKKRLKTWLIYRFVRVLAFWVVRLPRGSALKFCGFLDQVLNNLRKNANVRGISRDVQVTEMIRGLRRERSWAC